LHQTQTRQVEASAERQCLAPFDEGDCRPAAFQLPGFVADPEVHPLEAVPMKPFEGLVEENAAGGMLRPLVALEGEHDGVVPLAADQTPDGSHHRLAGGEVEEPEHAISMKAGRTAVEEVELIAIDVKARNLGLLETALL